MARKSTGRKEVIIDIAKSLFSQKGYDAASMDEIATQAGVPKSLIYYHFKSKEELLREVVSTFITEYECLMEQRDTNPIGAEKYFDFLYANQDFLKIIVMESLKSGNNAIPIFEVVRTILRHENGMDNSGETLDYHNVHARWVAEFFTSIIPFVMFTCYVDNWCEYFKTDRAMLKNDFISAYRQTHGNYHMDIEAGE